MCFYDVVCALVKCVVSTVKQCCTIKIDLYFTRNKHGSSECRIWIDFSNNSSALCVMKAEVFLPAMLNMRPSSGRIMALFKQLG